MMPLRHGHFEVETGADGLPVRLGPGGMGTTYRAFDTHLRISVALKVIDDRWLAYPHTRSRFFHEARVAAQLDHANIARVLYLCSEEAKTCFFATELIEGETLSQRLIRTGPLAPVEALRLLRQLVDALACLGQNQLVHRDIKPDNVILGADPRGAVRVKLIDFGLAKAVQPETNGHEPSESDETCLGSACFASPEQVRGGTLDQRSDFFALGATLWHALTGAPPFTGTLFIMSGRQVTREPPWEKVAGLPEETLALLRVLLAKEPSARPVDASALARHWDIALTALAAPNPPAKASLAMVSRLALTPTSLGSRLHWRRAEAVPHGSSPPASSGFLARDLSSQAWYFIRPLPETLPALLRAEIVEVAQRAVEVRHPALRRVIEVCAGCIVSEWELGLHLAQLLSDRGCPWPLEKVIAWLPGLAEAVDFARERDLSGLSLALVHQWMEVGPAAETTRRPVEQGGLAQVRLDPLAAFDPMLEAFVAMGMVPEALLAVPRVVALPSPYLAATAYRLLGGEEPPPHVPLQLVFGLDAVRNQLLVDTIESRVLTATAGEWAAAFTRGLPLAPKAAPPSPPVPAADPEPTARWVRELLILSGIFVLIGAGVALVIKGNSPPRTKPHVSAASGGEVVTLALRGPTPAEDRRANLSMANLVETTGSTPSPVTRARPAQPLPAGYFENSLGMRFKPCAITAALDRRPLRVSIWETRNADYGAFIAETGRKRLHRGTAAQLADHPAVMVSWNDAREFCRWLTTRERERGLIAANQLYRLPTDHEWSSFVGIAGINDELPGLPLRQKHLKILDLYVWGPGWPPPAGSGNVADATAKQRQPGWKVIHSYDDGFVGTAPVGSFPANPQGIFDISGNVSEWVWDASEVEGSHVLRGGSFFSYLKEELRASCRIPYWTDKGSFDLGFRVVLGSVP